MDAGNGCRLILLKVIYAQGLYDNSWVSKFIYCFTLGVKAICPPGGITESKNYTIFFFTCDELKKKINFCYFIRETKCVEFPHLKKKSFAIFVNKNVNTETSRFLTLYTLGKHFHFQCLYAHVYRTKSINEPLMRTSVLNMSPTHWKTNYSLAS